ncbi:hypothetical protein P7K49_020170 [Saguinus oedipus]|uniref:Uncharacterized protein n=1 Tax=Saguinus oedipus TaxID=9490 RepID=A0ABQ9V1A2_SAGOE|nr:hypothetical protein P7K49_020170 [Saguinus oedipus]
MSERNLGEESESSKERLEVKNEKCFLLPVSPSNRDLKSLALKSLLPPHPQQSSFIDHGSLSTSLDTTTEWTRKVPKQPLPVDERAPEKPLQRFPGRHSLILPPTAF